MSKKISATKCIVPGCKYYGKTVPKSFALHLFPQDNNLRRQWLININNKNLSASPSWVELKNCRVCGRHFNKEDYRDDVKHRVAPHLYKPSNMLVPGAVPTVNLADEKLKLQPVASSLATRKERKLKKQKVSDHASPDIKDEKTDVHECQVKQEIESIYLPTPSCHPQNADIKPSSNSFQSASVQSVPQSILPQIDQCEIIHDNSNTLVSSHQREEKPFDSASCQSHDDERIVQENKDAKIQLRTTSDEVYSSAELVHVPLKESGESVHPLLLHYVSPLSALNIDKSIEESEIKMMRRSYTPPPLESHALVVNASSQNVGLNVKQEDSLNIDSRIEGKGISQFDTSTLNEKIVDDFVEFEQKNVLLDQGKLSTPSYSHLMDNNAQQVTEMSGELLTPPGGRNMHHGSALDSCGLSVDRLPSIVGLDINEIQTEPTPSSPNLLTQSISDDNIRPDDKSHLSSMTNTCQLELGCIPIEAIPDIDDSIKANTTSEEQFDNDEVVNVIYKVNQKYILSEFGEPLKVSQSQCLDKIIKSPKISISVPSGVQKKRFRAAVSSCSVSRPGSEKSKGLKNECYVENKDMFTLMAKSLSSNKSQGSASSNIKANDLKESETRSQSTINNLQSKSRVRNTDCDQETSFSSEMIQAVQVHGKRNKTDDYTVKKSREMSAKCSPCQVVISKDKNLERMVHDIITEEYEGKYKQSKTSVTDIKQRRPGKHITDIESQRKAIDADKDAPYSSDESMSDEEIDEKKRKMESDEEWAPSGEENEKQSEEEEVEKSKRKMSQSERGMRQTQEHKVDQSTERKMSLSGEGKKIKSEENENQSEQLTVNQSDDEMSQSDAIINVPSDSQPFGCRKCHLFHPRYVICCPLEKISNIIPNEESDLPERFSFFRMLPSCLRIGKVETNSGILGVFTSIDVDTSTRFGPMNGKPLRYADIDKTTNLEHLWVIDKTYTADTECLSMQDEASANWMRLLRLDHTGSKYNLLKCVIDKQVYVVTSQPITAGSELILKAEDGLLYKNFTYNIVTKRHHKHCPKCNLDFSEEIYWQRHYYLYHHCRNIQFRYVCKVCGEIIMTYKVMLRHMATEHNSVKNYYCTYCKIYFDTEEEIIAHRSTHQDKKTKQVGDFQCKICSRRYNRRQAFFVHLKSHDKTASYQCTICNAKLKSYYGLTKHVRLHDETTKLMSKKVCHKCGKGFLDSANLKIHMLTHSGVKPFKCQEKGCPIAYTTKQSLEKHYISAHKYTNQNMPIIVREVPFTMDAYAGPDSAS